MSIQQVLLGSVTDRYVTCDSADFDGTNDSMARGGALTGINDGKVGTISVFVRIDSGTAGQILFAGSSILQPRVSVNWSSNAFTVSCRDSANDIVLSMSSSASYSAGASWYHVAAAWDLANAAASMYINGVSDDGTPTIVDDNIDYTSDWYCGAAAGPANRLSGCLAEAYFTNEFLDISIPSNLRKFRAPNGKPVFLGADGSVPTGTAALLYFHLDDAEAVANFATNRGTGGDFTITGTLATGSTSPSD
jgi:hypothetical protein